MGLVGDSLSVVMSSSPGMDIVLVVVDDGPTERFESQFLVQLIIVS